LEFFGIPSIVMLVEKTPPSSRKNIPKKRSMQNRIVARKNIPLGIVKMKTAKASATKLPATALLIVLMLPFLHFMK